MSKAAESFSAPLVTDAREIGRSLCVPPQLAHQFPKQQRGNLLAEATLAQLRLGCSPRAAALDPPRNAHTRCRAEELKLRTAERLVHLLAIFCILAWRIFWLTMMQRVTRRAAPRLAFTALEIELLARTAKRRTSSVSGANLSLHDCLVQLARLGGYLDRASDGPPGNTIMWRGMARLTDIALGYELAGGSCG